MVGRHGGASAAGKGGAIRAAAAAALQGGWQVVVLDPKEAGEYAWLELLGVPVVTELREQVATLEHLADVRRTRQEVVREYGADTWLSLPRDAPEIWRPVLLIVDEAASIPLSLLRQLARRYPLLLMAATRGGFQGDAKAEMRISARRGEEKGGFAVGFRCVLENAPAVQAVLE